MRTNNLLSILFLSFAFHSFPVEAQDDKYDALYLSIVKEYTLNPDGSTDYRYIKQQSLLTYRAFHNLYGETFVVYNPSFQKLKINDVFTLMADGKKIIAPQNAFNEVLPGYAANAPAYNSLREMVITHTGLERNATIHLDYQIHSEKGIYPALMGNELLAENEPIKNLEIRIRIPSGKNLYYKLFNAEIQPEKKVDGQFQVYIWKFNDLSAISSEESQPGNNEKYPRLVFSSSDDHQEIFSFLTDQPAFQLVLTDQMAARVNGLKAVRSDPFELALNLQELVVNDLRLYPIPLRASLYRCRTAEQTWNSNGGTILEKAVLYTSMLKCAGLSASTVGVIRTRFSDDRIASLSDIEDFAVMVDFKDRGLWFFSLTGLNPVNLKYILPDRSFIVLKPEEKDRRISAEKPKQSIKLDGTLIVSSDPKMTGEISISMDGSVYPLAGLMRDKKKMKASISGGLITNDTNNLKISKLRNEDGFQSYIAQSDKPFRKDTNFYYFTLPTSTLGIDSWGIKTLSTKRETPYEIPSLADENTSFTIALPTTLSLFTPQKSVVINNKAGTFTWDVRIDQGKLKVKRALQFNERIFELSNYKEFKILMDYWNNPWYRQLIFMTDNINEN